MNAFILVVLLCCGCVGTPHDAGSPGGPWRGVRKEREEEEGGSERDLQQIKQAKEYHLVPAYLSNEPFQQLASAASQYQEHEARLPRLLQEDYSPSTDNKFIWGCCLLLQWVLVLSRNLLLLGLFTHSLEIFLPYLILSESFLMLGFWTCEKHYLATLFAGVFASPWDLLNALRLLAQPPSSPANLPLLEEYGFSSVALCNLAGELLVAALLLAFAALSRYTTVCTKYEWTRKLASNLRPAGNGYFIAVLPRVLTLTGLHLRDFGHGAPMDTFNGITCALLLLATAAFFVLLFLQTRRAVAAQTDEERAQLGLVSRIDSRRQFSFDCLECSSLYLPCMGFLRLVLYFVPIGLIWDCNELAYGGPFASQFLAVVLETTSPAYIQLRDRILFPVMNFLMMLVQLSVVNIGLAESAPYSPLSENIEVVLLALLLALLGTSLACTGLDCWRELRVRCSGGARKQHGKSDTMHRFGQGPGRKTEESELEEQKQKDVHEQKTNIYPSSFKQAGLTRQKIKKVRTVKTLAMLETTQ